MTTHAKLSPSKRARWSRCPGSVREEARYPDERNPAAVDGTHTHSLLEYCLAKDVAQAASLIGTKLTDHDGEFVVDPARAERVQFALNYIDQRLSDLGDSTELLSEVKLELFPIFGRDDLDGTSDVVLISDNTIEVIDYKDGMGAVDAIGNLQLNQYAWGVAGRIGLDEFSKRKEVRMTIIQPKLREKGGAGIYYESMNMEAFLATADTLAAEAKATEASDAPLIPGEEQCKYCKHKGACSALMEKNMTAMGLDMSSINLAQSAVDKDPTTMTDHQIREIIEAAPLIRQMLESVEKEALARLDKGQQIDGLKLVRGRGSRAWSYNEKVMAEKLVKLGIPKGELYKTTLISPAQAEKLTWKKRDGTVKQLTERQLKVLHDEYITKSDGNLQVASASDERPAVVRDVSAMFAPTTDALPDFLQVPDWLK